MERVAYVLLAIVALFWLGAILLGMVVAFPAGLIGLIALVAIGLLLIKVLKERLTSEEDDYYDKHVER